LALGRGKAGPVVNPERTNNAGEQQSFNVRGNQLIRQVSNIHKHGADERIEVEKKLCQDTQTGQVRSKKKVNLRTF